MEGHKGVLYLLPNLLYPASEGGPPPASLLPEPAIERIKEIRHFIVEGDKAAWRLFSSVLDREGLAQISLARLDEHSREEELPALLEPALAGEDIGLLSDAGIPCVADPGGALTALAHDHGIRVVPLGGPSSLMLALSASGLDGQRFNFLGYLPQDASSRKAALKAIDHGVRVDGATRMFIETPYRNERLLADCLECIGPDLRLCVASALTTPAEMIRSMPIASWRTLAGMSLRAPLIGKEPAVFLVGRVPGTRLDHAHGIRHSANRPCRKPRR